MSKKPSQPAPSAAAVDGLPSLAALDLRGLLSRRWKMLTFFIVLGIGAGVAHYFTALPKYESEAQVLVMLKNSRLPTQGVDSASEDVRVSEDVLATHMQILQSPHIVGQAVKAEKLDQLESIINDLDEDEDAVEYIIDRLEVTRGGVGQAKTAHVLNANFRHESDADAQKILSAVVSSYQKFLSEKFQDVSKEAVVLISQAKDEIGKDLEQSEQAYQKFREEAPLLWKGQESANVHRTNYEQLEAKMAEVKVQITDTETRLNVIKSALTELDASEFSELHKLALIDDLHSERLERLVKVERGEALTEEFQAFQPARAEDARIQYDSILNLMLKEQTLSADLGRDHPQVQDVRKQLAMAKNFVDERSTSLGIINKKEKLDANRLLQIYVGMLNFDLSTLEKRRADMEVAAEKEHKAAKQLVGFELRSDTMRKDLERKQELHDAVLDRLREINLMKDYGGFVTEVIEPIKVGQQVWPSIPISVLLGGLLGLVMGGGAALLADSRDRTFRTPEEIREALDLPVLAHMPDIRMTRERKAAAAEHPEVHESVIVYHKPRSREAEAFRGLRTSIFFAARTAKTQVLAVTSSTPGDGKTTLCANLAASIAQSGRSVLLVDCDMRRARVHQMYHVEGEYGLAHIISGEVDPQDAIQPTIIENLSAVPCGPPPGNPAELLASPSFTHFIDWARERFDFVLLDSPPLLAVADPCIVASQADGVIFAVRISKGTRPMSLRAKEMLNDVHARILGVVVNGGEAAASAYGYGGYGKNYGYYGNYGATNVPNGTVYFRDEEAGVDQFRPVRGALGGEAPNGEPRSNGDGQASSSESPSNGSPHHN